MPLESRVRTWVTPQSPAEFEVPASANGKRVNYRWYPKYRAALQIGDALAIAISLALSFWLRFGSDGEPQKTELLMPILVGLTWMLFLSLTDSRNRRVLAVGLQEYRRVIAAGLYTFGALAIASYLFKTEPSRFVFAMALPLGIGMLLVWRWFLRLQLTRARRHGRASVPAVLVGNRSHVHRVARDLSRRGELGIVPAAAVYTDASAVSTANEPDLDHILISQVPGLVAGGHYGAVVVVDGVTPAYSRSLTWSLERYPVEILFVSELFDMAGPRMTVQTMEGMDLVHVDLPRFTGWPLRAKRIFDIAFSSVALVMLSPVFLAIAVAIKLDDRGPVMFKQRRIGLNGKEFTIHKFRTMRTDAEQLLEQLRSQSIGNGVLFKMDDDPRITRIGRFLRKYSLDELPQFWTVLGGHMSVVGPRPHLAKELDEFPDEGLRRLLIKPGITGLWQVSGRSDLSLDDSIKLDLRYVENWSLIGDLVVILKTIKTMLVTKGAY